MISCAGSFKFLFNSLSLNVKVQLLLLKSIYSCLIVFFGRLSTVWGAVESVNYSLASQRNSDLTSWWSQCGLCCVWVRLLKVYCWSGTIEQTENSKNTGRGRREGLWRETQHCTTSSQQHEHTLRLKHIVVVSLHMGVHQGTLWSAKEIIIRRFIYYSHAISNCFQMGGFVTPSIFFYLRIILTKSVNHLVMHRSCWMYLYSRLEIYCCYVCRSRRFSECIIHEMKQQKGTGKL